MKAHTAIQWGALLASVAGLCGAVWIDANGAPAGVGYAPLAAGSIVALVALLARRGAGMPHDAWALCARVGLYAALSFLLALVLAPDGAWLYAELVVLVLLLTRERPRTAWLGFGASTFVWLCIALAFKLWLLRQGSLQQWQVAQLDVPVVSWVPLDILRPFQTIDIGSFTASELGLPPSGLAFGLTSLVLAVGFVSAVASIALLSWGEAEHEDDRVAALLSTLPPAVAQLVEALIPEREWSALGLHGLSDRKLARRMEELMRERARALQHSQIILQHPAVRQWLALPEQGKEANT